MKSKNLTIFKAAAGSGKTHYLSQQYISYLLSAHDNNAYKKILAVTFTNDATKEMKSRILELLNQLPDELVAKFGEKGREDALSFLKKIVHDYSMFRVSTIDSFFQSVLRSFAFEMGRKSAFELSLDNSAAIEQSIKALYKSIGENKTLLDILLSIAQRESDKGKGWDFRKNVLAFCNRVKEDFPKLKRAEPNLFAGREEFEKELAIRRDETRRMEELCRTFRDKAYSIYRKLGIVFSQSSLGQEDFTGQSSSPIFKVLKSASEYEVSNNDWCLPLEDSKKSKVNSDFRKNCLDPEFDCTHKKSKRKEEVVKLLGDVRNIAGEYESLMDEGEALYRTYLAILKNVQETFLLSDINNQLVEFCTNEGVSLISETPELIHALIAGSEIPFIYERIGTSTEHFLLDEFQDTSDLQWENFRPLIKESVDSNRENLIVGDVKQSIYRFRGGEWEILNSQVESEFADSFKIIGDGVGGMSTNYRSLSNIVEFNNRLFCANDEADSKSIPNLMQDSETLSQSQKDELRRIYANSQQKVSSRSIAKAESGVKGYVEIITQENSARQKMIFKRDEVICSQTAAIIRRLTDESLPLDLRYRRGQIAVLVNSNDEGKLIVNFLMRQGIKVISAQSLPVDSSDAVFTILTILRYLVKQETNPKEGEVLLELLESLHEISLCNKELLWQLKQVKTIYDLCQMIIERHLPIALKKDLLFITHFLDRVLDFSASEGGNLAAFLRWWDDKGSEFTVQTPSNPDSVQVMTMHKAKGLAFDVVIVPFLKEPAAWMRSRWRKNQVWIKYDGGTSSEFLYPHTSLVDFDGDTEKTLFKERYHKEYFNNVVDCINLTYVSFTRAKEKLYIFANRYNKEDTTENSDSIALEIIDFCKSSEDVVAREFTITRDNYAEYITDVAPKDLDNDKLLDYTYTVYSFGNELEKDNSSAKADIVREGDSSSVIISDYTTGLAKDSQASIDSRLKISDFGEMDDMRHKGIVLHQLYSYLSKWSPEEAVDRLISKNPSYRLISENRDEMIEQLKFSISKVANYNWFGNERYRVFAEQEILHEGSFYRPDMVLIPVDTSDYEAVVVDFKFGEQKENRYHRQVGRYCSLMREMGFKDVRGYIWYVNLDLVESV